MNWFADLFGAKPAPLSSEQAQRLAAWQALPAADVNLPASQGRYVVVDVESSGLNVNKDRLIAIGAIAVVGGRVDLGDGLDIVLQQDKISDKANILIHGISGTAQREGVPPAEALLTFLEYLGKDPLMAFHVAFDNTMISKALRRHLGLKFEHPWSDLAYMTPALYIDLVHRCRSLDHWMEHFGIGNFARHSALADALSTAELLLALRPRMAERKIDCFRKMRDLYLAQKRATSPLAGV